MKAIACTLASLVLLCACDQQRKEAEAACRPIIVKPRYCHYFGGMDGPVCAYAFDELVALTRCPRISPHSAGVQVAGVLKRKDSSYFFYKDLSSPGSAGAAAIEVKTIRDGAVDDQSVRDKLVGGKVVVVGNFDPMGGTIGSLDLHSVRWYTGNYVIPPPGTQLPIY